MNWFRKKSAAAFEQVGLSAPKSDAEFADFLNTVMTRITERAKSEQDFYWFLIEIYDFIANLTGTKEILSGFYLHDLEYRGSKSEESYPGKRNEAATYVRDHVMSSLRRTYSESDANVLLALTYVLIVGQNSEAISNLRVKYASHYRNNCLKSGSHGNAEKWAEIIETAANQTISIAPFEQVLPWNRGTRENEDATKAEDPAAGKSREKTNIQKADVIAAERVEEFLAKYDRSGADRSRYAMTMWGIHEAFLKIFGGLDGYNAADPTKKRRYIEMLGNNAIKFVRDGHMIESDCNSAFLNFVVAANGVPRRKLRGSIEIAADRIEGIVRVGGSEMNRIGKMEKEANDFLASDATFAIGTGEVKGAVTERNVVAASQLIINDLHKILVSHQDYYLYIIEQYVRLRPEPGIRTQLDGVPLFDIECELLGKSWSQDNPQSPGVAYIEAIRPAIRTWCQLTVPSLDPDELSLRVIGAAYGHFRITGKSHFDQIRRGYAQHYRDRCFSQGQQAGAARWAEVVDKIPG